MNELKRLFKMSSGRDMTEDELLAAAEIIRIPAPLGLSEWECSDGEVYLKSTIAVAHQMGILKSEASHD